ERTGTLDFCFRFVCNGIVPLVRNGSGSICLKPAAHPATSTCRQRPGRDVAWLPGEPREFPVDDPGRKYFGELRDRGATDRAVVGSIRRPPSVVLVGVPARGVG